ncbi:PKD repeat protein/uncharacterized GH25 family protein [Pseudarthrobacter sp. PvP022]
MNKGPRAHLSGFARAKRLMSVAVSSALVAGLLVLQPGELATAQAVEPAAVQFEPSVPTDSPTPTPSPSGSAEASPQWTVSPQNDSEADQRMRPGQYSPKALSVRLTDEADQPVAGVKVTFEVRAGEATFDRSNAKTLDLTTDADGVVVANSRINAAMSGLLADSSYVGTIEVEARAEGSSSTFVFDQIHSTVAERLEYVEGRDQTVHSPYEILKPLVVRAVDGDGKPVSGATVEFTAKNGTANFGWSYPATTFSTGDDGTVRTSDGAQYYQVLRSGISPESLAVDAEVEARIAGLDPVLFTIPLAPVEAVEIMSGDGQEVAGEDYFQSLQVRVKDKDGTHLGYRNVSFDINGEAGFMVNGEAGKSFHAVSQYDGSAAVPWYTLRANPGSKASGTPLAVTAAAGTKTATFNLKIVKQPRAWNLTQAYGGNQTVAAGGAFAAALGVYARDEQGRYAGYAPVTFSIVNGGGSYFAGPNDTRLTTIAVDADRYGHAATPQVWAGDHVGAFTVKATTPDFAGELIFDLDVVGQPAGIQVYPGAGAAAYPESTLGWPYAVVTDNEGRPVGNQTVTFRVESGAVGFGRSLDGSEKTRTAVTDSNGVAYAGEALYTGAGKSAYGPAVVSAGVAGGPRTEVNYTVSSYPVAEQLLTVSGEGLSAKPGGVLAPVSVTAVGAGWSNAGYAEVTFTLEGETGSYFVNDQGVRIDGPATVTASNYGYATAPQIIAGDTTGKVVLRAATPGAPDLLVNLSVSGGVGKIVKTSQDNLEVFPEDRFGYLTVRVEDEGGNPVGNEAVTFTVREGGAEFSNYWWGCYSQPSGRTTVTVQTDSYGNASSPVHLCAVPGPDSAGDVVVDVEAAGVLADPFTFKVKPLAAATSLVTYGMPAAHVKTGDDLNGFAYAYATGADGSPAGYADVTFAIVGETDAKFKITDPATGDVRLESEVTLRADRWGNVSSPTISAGQVRGEFSLTAKSSQSNELRWDGLRVVGPIATVTAVAGDNQKSYPNNYMMPLRVVARDSDGYSVPNQPVTFRLPENKEHRFSYNWSTAIAGYTDSNGEATPGYYGSTVYIGNSPGTFTVSVDHNGQSYPALTLEALDFPTADTFNNLGGGGQSVQPGAGFPARMSARVSNHEVEVGVPGVSVTFSIEGSTDAYFVLDNGTRASTAAVTSDASGYAVAPALFAGSQGGSFTVTAAAAGITSATFDMAVLSSARSLEKVSGDEQSERIGKAFRAVDVAVKDSAGNPVANQRVRFVTENPSRANFGGAFRTYATTNSEGLASSGGITAGTETGPVVISANTGTLEPVQFTLTTEPLLKAAELTEPTGDGQIAVAGTVFGAPLGIRTVDADGNPAEQVQVTYTITGPEGATFQGGSATFTAKTDADGRIYSPLIPAGNIIGPLTVVASADGVEPFHYGLTVKAPNAPPQLQFSTSATAVELNDPVTYTLDASDAEGDPLTYTIDFGDGGGAQGSYPSSQAIRHSYGQAGTYLVYATVRDGTSSVSKTSRVTVILTEPLLPDAGDPQQSVTGQAVTFDAGRSRPAALIHEYLWDFGDGTTGTGLRAQHTYAAPGDYAVSLTVRNGSETATATSSVKVSQAAAVPGLSVTVKSGASLVSGAIVTTNLSDGRRITATSGSDGIAVLAGLPNGDHSVFISAGGHLPLVATGTVVEGSGSLQATLAQGDVGTSVLETRQLTIDEIVDLGIDPQAPENQQVFESEIHLAVAGSDPDVPEETPVRVVWNDNNQIGISTDPGEPIYWVGSGGNGGCCITIGDYDFTPSTVQAGGQRVVQWLIVPTKGSFLKEFFEARLLVQNLASTPFTFTQGQAELSLPKGVSLAPTSASQNLAIPMQDIPGGESRTASWTLRGDTEGEYNLSATYTGVLEPLGEPLRIEARTDKPLKVWGGSALQMEVTVDPSTVNLHPFRVTVKLRNKTPEGAGTVVYNPTFEVLQGTNYLLAPAVEYKKSAASLRPGETLEAEYIFYSRVSGEVLLNDGDLAKSFIVSTGGSVDVEYLPLQKHPARTDALDVKAQWVKAPGDTHKMFIAWETVTGASQYSVFSRDSLDSGEWRLVTEGAVGELSDARMLDEGSSQLGEYYAVVPTLEGGATKPTHRVATASKTPPPDLPVASGAGIISGSTMNAPQCMDVLFVGAAGSGEKLLGPNMTMVATQLKSELEATRTYAAVYLDYPAAAVPLVGGDSTVDFETYMASIEEGVTKLTSFLAQRNVACPYEKLVLGGYSQGGVVLSRVMADNPALVSEKKVAGAYLVANASNHLLIGGQREGSAVSNTGVGAVKWTPKIPEAVAPVTMSLCDSVDIVCDSLQIAIGFRPNLVGFVATALSVAKGYEVHTTYHERDDTLLKAFATRTSTKLKGVAVPKSNPYQMVTLANEAVDTTLGVKDLRDGVHGKWTVTHNPLPAGTPFTVSSAGKVTGSVPAGFWKFDLSLVGEKEIDRRIDVNLEIRSGWAAIAAQVVPVTTVAPGTVLKPLALRVLDANGNPVAGAEVEFRVDGPASFAGGAKTYKAWTTAEGYAVSTTPLPTGGSGTLSAAAEVPGQPAVVLQPQEVVAAQVLPEGVSATVTPRVVSGKVALEAKVSNGSTEAKTVTLSGRYGSKNLGILEPGASATHLFATGQKQISQGTVLVTAKGALSSGSQAISYAAYNPAAELKLENASSSESKITGSVFAPYAVRLVRGDGTVVSGASVTFDVAGPARFGDMPSTTVATDASGYAVTSVPLNATTEAGTVTATARAEGAAALALPERTVTLPSAEIDVRSSSYVKAVNGKIFIVANAENRGPAAVDITVQGRYGKKTLLAVAPGGAVSHAFATGLTKIAAGSLTFTSVAGTASSVSTAGYSAAGPGLPALLQPDNAGTQSVRVGQTFVHQPVRVLDSVGVAVANVEVRFDVAGAASFAGGALSSNGFTDAQGWARPALELFSGPATGTAKVTASVPGVAPLTLPELNSTP